MATTWFISVFCLLSRYYYKRKWQNLQIPKEIKNRIYNNDYTKRMASNRRKNFFSWNLLFDLIILTIQPFPFMDLEIRMKAWNSHGNEQLYPLYLLSDFILLFMFLRFYILIRNIFNHSQFSDPYAKLHCERYGFTANTRFVFKCYLQRYPGYTVFMTLFTSVLMLAYMMRIAERPTALEDDLHVFEPFINNVYMTVVTMTTVGFGDFAPLSYLGKIVTMVTALWGGFIISLLIVSVEGIFSLSNREQKAFSNLVLVKKAARCLVSALRYRLIQKKMERNQEFRNNGTPSLITEPIAESTRLNAFKKLIKRLAKFTEAAVIVKKFQGEDSQGIDPIDEIGHELIEMNVKIEKMNDIVTA